MALPLPRSALVVAATIGAFVVWKQLPAPETVAGSFESQATFRAAPLRTSRAPQVFVIAALDCPQAAARRADHLLDKLRAKGIPVQRTNVIDWDIEAIRDPETLQRVQAIGDGELPLVAVRGRIANNPSLEDVVAEYQRGAD